MNEYVLAAFIQLSIPCADATSNFSFRHDCRIELFESSVGKKTPCGW